MLLPCLGLGTLTLQCFRKCPRLSKMSLSHTRSRGSGLAGGGPPGLFANSFGMGNASRLDAPLNAGGMSSNAASLTGAPLGVAPGGGRGDLLAAIAMGLPGLQNREEDRCGCLQIDDCYYFRVYSTAPGI